MSKPIILCVDDDRTVLSTLRNQLLRHFQPNYTIEIAESGIDGLELLAELQAEGATVPVVIADYIMPGMKGDEFLIQVHAAYPSTLKILLTGQADADAVGNIINAASLYRYIAKPWDEADLYLTITEALRRYQQDQQLLEHYAALQQANQQLAELNASLEQKVQQRTEDLQQEIIRRQIVEAELRASKEKYKIISERSPVGIWQSDAEGHCIYANEKVQQLTGLSREQILANGWPLAIHPDDRQATLAKWAEVTAQMHRGFSPDSTLELRYLHPDGSVTWGYAETIVERNAAGEITGFIGTVTDITDRKRAEIALQETSRRYAILTESSPVGVFRTDAQGYCLYVNPRWCELAGLKPQEVMGLGWIQALHPDDLEWVIAAWNQAIQNQVLFHTECRFQKPDGTVVWLVVEAVKELDTDHQVVGYVGTITDISELKQTEAALKNLVEITASKTERDFFVDLVHYLVEALQVEYAIVAKYIDQQYQPQVLCSSSGQIMPLPTSLQNPAIWQQLLASGEYCCQRSLQQQEQINQWVAELGVESCMGMPLIGSDCQPIGYLCILDTKPIVKVDHFRSVLKLFADRATAELERQQVKAELQQLNQELEQRVYQRTEEVQRQTQLLRTILNSMGDSVLVINTEGDVILHNPAAENLIGTALLTLTPAQWEELWDIYLPDATTPCPIESRPLARAMRGETLNQLEVCLRNALHPEGIPIEVTLRPLTDVTGRLIGGVVVFRDIRDRKQAESTLRDSEARLRLALIAANQGLYDLNVQTGEAIVSPEYATMLGYDPETFQETNQKWIERLHPDDHERVSHVYRAYIQGELPLYKVEFRQRTKMGDWKWILSLGRIVTWDAAGQPLRMLGTHTDISDRKQAEAALQNLNAELEQRVEERTIELRAAKEAADAANQAKSNFLASISHELRTPLNGVMGYAQILQSDVSLTDKQRDAVGIIYRCASHLLTLINDILDLSKIEAGKLELLPTEVHFPSFLQSIVEICAIRADQKELSLDFQNATPLPTVIQVDEKRLRQVLINLLSNAVKFTNYGSVTFKVEVLNTLDDVATIRFQVEDTGPGICGDDFEKIFQPFEQVSRQHHTEGTGLGLAISQRIVQMMGSHIYLESVLGQGSRFWFDTVVGIRWGVDVTEHRSPSQGEIIGYVGKKRKVLVVDDHWENRSIFVHFLQPLNFQILEADNGDDGLQKAIMWQPDLIITDLQMPVMDGLTMTRRLRQLPQFQQVIILASSANVFEWKRQQSQEAGCDAFLPRPIELPQLLIQIAHYLNITWLYDTSSIERSQDRSDALDLIIPPWEELSILYRAARLGDTDLVEQEASRIQQLSDRYSPFAQRILQLNQMFNSEAILQLIQAHTQEIPENHCPDIKADLG